ncbi:hypothetical protein Asi02nite_65750 [Asanoa siamensis]|uniref:Uncharacterized protein n=1 Tax=Asanoa siamensis TaxID=926357 RepID=A0ABQ4D0I6_9ACTN|nr:hypothetical protein Asi02nite_65750 [Asanoa siamensis]
MVSLNPGPNLSLVAAASLAGLSSAPARPLSALRAAGRTARPHLATRRGLSSRTSTTKAIGTTGSRMQEAGLAAAVDSGDLAAQALSTAT